MHLIARHKDHQNRAVIDPWTAVHLSTGLALGLMDVEFEKCLIAAFAYEIIEQGAERQNWGQELFRTNRPETLVNAAMDVVVFSVGHWLGSLWNRTGRGG